MDAVEFAKAFHRMCMCFDGCKVCPLDENECYLGHHKEFDAQKCVATVAQWAKEHPSRTRQTELLKMFPNAKLDAQGVIDICPHVLEPSNKCKYADLDSVDRASCLRCRIEFWGEEVEGGKENE